MDKLVLRIPYATPSLNSFAHKRTRWAYRLLKTRWMRYVSEAYLEEKAARGRGPAIWTKPPQGKVRVTVERFARTDASLDVDNLYGGVKPALDALRELRLIDDDRPDAIELVVRQAKSPYRAPALWTQLTLERLEDA